MTPFKGDVQEVILLDVKVNNVVAKAVCDLGWAGFAISRYLVNSRALLVEIQAGKRVGIWTPAEPETAGLQKNKKDA